MRMYNHVMVSSRNRVRAELAELTSPGFRNISKMLGVYLDDVDQLVRSEDAAKATRLAALLPHIVAALEDPVMRGSCAAADGWAERWLLLEGGEASSQALRARWHPACSANELHSTTAEIGLRQLRLRRHSRESLAVGYPSEVYGPPPSPGTELRFAYDIVSAVREWYTESGLDEPRVQQNLARLALLRS